MPVAVKRPGSATEALPEMWRSVVSVTVSGCRVRLGAVVVKVAQSSLVAPAPDARFSCRAPFVTETVIGERTRLRVIAEASTPSQLFAPWVIETRFSVPLVVTPATVTEVSRWSESAWAFVPTCAALALLLSPVTWPRSRASRFRSR